MDYPVDFQTLYLIAEAELRKLPEYKNSFSPIPPNIVNLKVNEFYNLSPEELQSKITAYFSSKEENSIGWQSFGLNLSTDQQSNEPFLATPSEVKNKNTTYDINIREFAVKLLLNDIINANGILENYRNSFGYISFDAIWHGLNNGGDWIWDGLSGRDDFNGYHEKSNNITQQINQLIELNSIIAAPLEFQNKFKDFFGLEFNINAFQNLQHADQQLKELNTYEALSNDLAMRINSLVENEEITNWISAVSIIQPLFGNDILKAKEYVLNLQKYCSTDEDFKEKFIAALTNAKVEADNKVNDILSKTSRETLENNYKQAYKNAMGNSSADEDIERFIQNAQENTMYTEIALTTAASILTMGSSTVTKLSLKAASALGTKVGGTVVKTGMVIANATLSAGETVLSAVTSENGLTEDILLEAGNQFKNGIIFGAFGSYVSGPIGDKVVTLLKSNPKITSTIMQKIFEGVGFATEVSIDALFEMNMTDEDWNIIFTENAEGEALGRFMSMILGGQAHKVSNAALENLSVKQEIDESGNVKYSVIKDGKLEYETNEPDKLIAGILAITAEANSVTKVNETVDYAATSEVNTKDKKSQTIDVTTLKIEKASIDDLKAIQKIDIEAFKDNYVIASNFDDYKVDLEEQGISTYAIKSDNGDVIGYYQLEPVKNGELYIHSIGVRSDLRNTKTSYAAIKQMQKSITKFVQENNIEKVVLDVDASKPELVKLYKKFGFEITAEDKGVEAGKEYHDYRMEIDVREKEGDNLYLKELTDAEFESLKTKLENKLRADKDFSKNQIANILQRTNEQNIALAEKLCADKDFPKEQIMIILCRTNKQNLESKLNIYDLMKKDKDFPKDQIANILYTTNKQNFESKLNIYDLMKKDKDFPKEQIGVILEYTNEQNIALAEKLCADKDFPKEQIGVILKYTNEQNIALAEKLCADKDFPKEQIGVILEYTNEQNIAFVEKLCADKDFPKEQIANILQYTCQRNIALVEKLCADKDFTIEQVINILQTTNIFNSTFIDSEYEIMKSVLIYFNKNLNSLKHQDIDVTSDMVATLIFENKKGVLNIVNLIGEPALRHASELRYKGLKQLLENAWALDNLSEDTKNILKSKLEQLPHPEQKLSKLEVIAAISRELEDDAILEIANKISNPKMTTKQKELADEIFSTNKPYEEQINDFIRTFNVPKERESQFRKFLLEQKLNEKYVTPPSAEEQIAIIDKKIQSIISNDKIPMDKKQAYLNNLEQQKANITAHPEQYTKARINDCAIKLLEAQVEAHINLPNQNKEFTRAINEQIYKILKIDITEALLTDISYDSKYISKLFGGVSDTGFKNNFNELIELIKANPNKKFTDIIRNLSHNIETKELFEANGLDFERWITFDATSKQPFTVKVDVEKAVRTASVNLRNELNSELAMRLDQNEIAKLIQILEDNNIDTATQKDLPKIMKLIEKELETNEYWKSDSPDIKTFKDHIKIHKKNIHDVEHLKDITEELYVRLWDNDDVGRNIFFGNHVGCCTSVGSFNSFAAPQHLMNTFVNGIEIVDKSGNSMGNSMCYFAKVDGQLTFVIDSFEANGKLGASSEVTDAIIAYAKKVCAEMGQPNANIMFGPNYNKIDFSRCIKTDGHEIEIIGRADNDTYIDGIGGPGSINTIHTNRPMHEIMDL